MGNKIFLLLLLASPGVCQKPFTDITEDAGIKHQFKVFEGMFGGGACVFDFDNDGWEDVYITGGVNSDVLYKNLGNGKFIDVFEGSGLEITGKYVTQGVASADVNRDGFRDLFVTTITTKGEKKVIPRAENLFFINQGDGTFRDASNEYGIDRLKTFSTAVNFGDFNGDGWPDAYIGNYFNQFEGELSVINDATVVGANQTAEGNLLLNIKGKRFKDVYEDYGLDFKGFGFGGLFTDYDKDGDQDLFINHDFGYKRTPDMLLRNDFPEEKFSDVSDDTKMNLRINSMGTAVGDYNGDGWLDYYMTNIRFNYLMTNQGPEKPFINKVKEEGLSYASISWGANFVDFDQDGDVDLFVSNGDLNPNCVPIANFYFENNYPEPFTERAAAVGLNNYGIGRGSVVFDFDHDGDMDILQVNQEAVLQYPVESTTRLFRNDAAIGNWLKIALKGHRSESNGLGSRIELFAGDKRWIQEIDGGGSSHISQNSAIAHFGLGKVEKIDTIKVFWTGGETEIMLNQDVNKQITVEQKKQQLVEESKISLLFVFFSLVLTGMLIYVFYKKRHQV